MAENKYQIALRNYLKDNPLCTQQELSNALNVSQVTISRWLSGEVLPKKYAAKLDFFLKDYLSEDDEESLIIDLIRRMGPREKEELVRVAKKIAVEGINDVVRRYSNLNKRPVKAQEIAKAKECLIDKFDPSWNDENNEIPYFAKQFSEEIHVNGNKEEQLKKVLRSSYFIVANRAAICRYGFQHNPDQLTGRLCSMYRLQSEQNAKQGWGTFIEKGYKIIDELVVTKGTNERLFYTLHGIKSKDKSKLKLVIGSIRPPRKNEIKRQTSG